MFFFYSRHLVRIRIWNIDFGCCFPFLCFRLCLRQSTVRDAGMRQTLTAKRKLQHLVLFEEAVRASSLFT